MLSYSGAFKSPTISYLPELLQSRFQILHDLLSDNIRIGKVVGGFEAFRP